jgi:hypothetical protein
MFTARVYSPVQRSRRRSEGSVERALAVALERCRRAEHHHYGIAANFSTVPPAASISAAMAS